MSVNKPRQNNSCRAISALLGKRIEIHTCCYEFPIFRGHLRQIFSDNSVLVVNDNIEDGNVRIKIPLIKKIIDLSSVNK